MELKVHKWCAMCGHVHSHMMAVQNTGYYSKEATGLWMLVYKCDRCDFRWVNEELSCLLIEAQLEDRRLNGIDKEPVDGGS